MQMRRRPFSSSSSPMAKAIPPSEQQAVGRLLASFFGLIVGYLVYGDGDG